MGRRKKHYNLNTKKKQKEDSFGFVLTIQDGRHRGEEYHFETEATIGRTDDNSIVIIDNSISRNHARVWGKRGVFLVEDFGSSNGTRLNGKVLMEPEVLKDGDYITTGVVNLMFSNLDIDSAGEPTQVIQLSQKQCNNLDHETKDVNILEKVDTLWETKQGKVYIIAAVSLFFVLLFWGVTSLLSSGETTKKKVEDQSDYVVHYNEKYWKGFLNKYYGHCGSCIPHKKSLKISFDVAIDNTRVVISYAAGMIEKDKEVEILLNGNRIQYADWAPPNKPKYNYTIDLYRAAKKNPNVDLKIGKNIIEFNNLYNTDEQLKQGKKIEYWVVFYIRIITIALPKPNIEEAENNYTIAKQSFENRELSPKNYKDALKKFHRVLDLLERVDFSDDKNGRLQAMYKDSLRTINIINRELDNVFRSCRATIVHASRYTNQKERQKAKIKLEKELIKFLPSDLRKQKLKSEIKSYLSN
ncbi:MAG: FHA domain-containing protein [Deltaproteobacteria bacterium]|jgi:pSer/pThr/pTyr-binding forkhead associated (FHA) protein|nr:FHA domain-containing protein [Deltaproteobacteria bacterium]